MQNSNDEVYDGEWKNDKRQGYGIMQYSFAQIYRGNWENDKRHG
jgi:hypothetical protein